MFETQFYIQENDNLRSLIHRYPTEIENIKLPRIPWKPYPAGRSEIARIEEINENGDVIMNNNNELVPIMDDERRLALSQSVLYGADRFTGQGYFLYSNNDLNKTQKAICNNEDDIDDDDDAQLDNSTFDAFSFIDDNTPVQIVIVSLWYWW